jgi:hypothetical protein
MIAESSTVRRLDRPPEMPRLTSIRSLYYFGPLIEELLERPLPAGYPEYLEMKIALLIRRNLEPSEPALDHISTFSRDR